jgi:hypothetical protein
VEALLLLPAPEVLLGFEALVLEVLELGAEELAEVDPLGLVLLAELALPASHVPFTWTLWPTCALRSSELSSCTPFGCFLSTRA